MSRNMNGQGRTDKMLEMTKEMAEKRGIRSIVVASTRGSTGVKASEVFKGYNVIVKIALKNIGII